MSAVNALSAGVGEDRTYRPFAPDAPMLCWKAIPTLFASRQMIRQASTAPSLNVSSNSSGANVASGNFRQAPCSVRLRIVQAARKFTRLEVMTPPLNTRRLGSARRSKAVGRMVPTFTTAHYR